MLGKPTTAVNTWNKSYERDIDSAADKIWQAFIDTSNWSRWNSGVKSINLEGAFQSGVWFSMELPDGFTIRSQLIDVVEQKHFIDETWIDTTRVRVEHRIEALRPGYSKVVYAVSVEGPDAQSCGEGVSSDFPDVIEGLAKYLANK